MAFKVKYTKKYLVRLVKKHRTVADIIRELGLKVGSGSHGYLCKKIKTYKINTSHFLGLRGTSSVVSSMKKHYSEILIQRTGAIQRRGHHQLSRALIESGRKHKCELCGIGPIWNELPLTLVVDHRNGNTQDDRSKNVRFLCPNCHTQTPNYGRKKERQHCKHCDVQLGRRNKSGFCPKCCPLFWKKDGGDTDS
jgi:Zn finger protein HypA/HybF involved in hydrogenase expression